MKKPRSLPYRRWLRLSPRSQWTYSLLVPWFVPLISYFLIGTPYIQHWKTFLGGTLFVWLLTTLAFITHDWAADAIGRFLPNMRQTLLRAFLTLLAFMVLSGLFLLVYTWLFIRFQLFGSQLTYDTVCSVYLFDVVAIVGLVLIYEVFYLLEKWKESKLSKESLKKASLQGQLQSLKNQISPHFLFNSLNSLSSLIADEPQRAERFVDEMAKVYRYLLQTNDQELTPLSVELAFIQSYYHLLKTRHGPGLRVEVAVDHPYLHYQLPPLTLQMLVENAVKHNTILATRPLCITITTTAEGQLRVSNNLQRKTSRVESNHIGLANIKARYELLSRNELFIEETAKHFTITLPLLTQDTDYA
ncbi:hypothetical protein GCM10027275_05750 [Rhabdobacter roseus]|uniref:Sensor histidine kinase YesM n=1 Tax=Rhabdobacter roseus TaxID=1655419 RepID=A0A840THN6_9BACT|nr:histidine kinase [Rhabdobacter roseus]MBB5282465.1 sensor histidine kinase YesM [Rhabdobacter roseus]